MNDFDLDFTIPPKNSTANPPANPPASPPAAPSPISSYDTAAALEFFKSAGKAERVAAGKIIFVEEEKGSKLLLQRDKMYLLLDGEVGLSANNKPIGIVKNGEIFGEMTSISQLPRSATAMANTACSLLTLDSKQFQAALRNKPEFALMLMVVMVGRLRGGPLERLGTTNAASADGALKESSVFDKKLLTEMAHEIGGGSLIRFEQGKVIMAEGQAGLVMYVVQEGRVAIRVQDCITEKVGPGGVFGEMALVERAQRLASAVAETNGTLLAISRNVFLDLVKTNPEFAIALLRSVSEKARLWRRSGNGD